MPASSYTAYTMITLLPRTLQRTDSWHTMYWHIGGIYTLQSRKQYHDSLLQNESHNGPLLVPKSSIDFWQDIGMVAQGGSAASVMACSSAGPHFDPDSLQISTQDLGRTDHQGARISLEDAHLGRKTSSGHPLPLITVAHTLPGAPLVKQPRVSRHLHSPTDLFL